MADIHLSHISFSYEKKTVFSDFSLTLPQGKITVLMGESGKGKTTLLRILAGLETIRTGAAENVPSEVSVVFQEDRLAETFSVLTNVLLVQKKPDEKKAREALEDLGLSDVLNAPVSTLSGGMKRRVALARAVLFPSALLLCDEAFKGLDGETKRKAAAFLLKEQRGRTVLFITHDKEDADLLHAPVVTV
ncbi:MAG: ATP-binding cassette domain-containing protein [Clostridia bacterium]|nr:ATP-binding cassette domain-containing protein [Clostridia bacterium]